MSDRFTVNEPGELLPLLQQNLHGWSKATIKQRLVSGRVLINDQVVTRHNHALNRGDRVEVRSAAQSVQVRERQLRTQALTVLFQDRSLVAINKPAGLLSVANADNQAANALALLRLQLSHNKAPVKLWPAHRLDRETSGVLLFTTTAQLQQQVQDAWDKSTKIYLAVVQGKPKLLQGSIDQPLRMDEKLYFAHVGPHPDAKPALTEYRVLASANNRSLLEVNIRTGRQHQIRAHMAWLGHPIVGDERYGKAGERMGLHASKLIIVHPVTGKSIEFNAPVPPCFKSLMPHGQWTPAITQSGFD